MVIILFLYRRILKQRVAFAEKTAQAIKEFKEGIRKKQKQIDKQSKLEDFDTKTQHHASILEEPYNEGYEVPRDQWKIGNHFPFFIYIKLRKG